VTLGVKFAEYIGFGMYTEVKVIWIAGLGPRGKSATPRRGVECLILSEKMVEINCLELGQKLNDLLVFIETVNVFLIYTIFCIKIYLIKH